MRDGLIVSQEFINQMIEEFGANGLAVYVVDGSLLDEYLFEHDEGYIYIREKFINTQQSANQIEFNPSDDTVNRFLKYWEDDNL